MPGHIWGYRFSLDLPNLKTSMLTTTFDDFTMDDLNRTLNYYPKLVSMKLIIKDVFSFVMVYFYMCHILEACGALSHFFDIFGRLR